MIQTWWAPVAALLEGGYDLDGLSFSVAATLEGLTGIDPRIAEQKRDVREAPFAVAAARARAVRRVIGEYWEV